MGASLTATDRATVSLLDGLALFWVVLWLFVGIVTGVQVSRLSGLTDAATASAQAVDSAGTALQGLGDLPAIGDTSADLGDEVRAAAREITRTTEETEAIVYRLAVLLGLSVTLIPIAPVLGVYLPLRLRRRSYVAGLRRQVRSGQGGPALDAFLAHQAVSTMSFGELRSVTADPVGDLLAGRHRKLADEHLRRLGITRRATGAWRASP